MVLRKKPECFQQAVKDATEVEFALSFDASLETSGEGRLVHAVTGHPPISKMTP